MRKLIFAINISLDGCCDHTKFNPDEEVLNYFTQLTQDAGLLIYGRKTYELMVPFWPDMAKHNSGDKAENEFARAFDSIGKVVFSKSSGATEEGNTRVVNKNLKEEILRLKQEKGDNMLTSGVSIPSQLMELGLVDEYHFMVHPILAGARTRLLQGTDLQGSLQLKLVSTKTFKSGCVALRYVKQ